MLDDYHVIREPAIHEGMRFVVAHLPVVSHLVIATRVEPPVDVSRLRARGELGEIVSDQLQFSDAEVEALLNDTLALELPPSSSSFFVPRPRAGPPAFTSRDCRCAIVRGRAEPTILLMTATWSTISATRSCPRRSRSRGRS